MFVSLQNAAFRQYSLRCLLSQDVLLQEDVELIELLDPSILSLGSTDTICPSASTAVPAPRYLAPPSIWYTLYTPVNANFIELLMKKNIQLCDYLCSYEVIFCKTGKKKIV